MVAVGRLAQGVGRLDVAMKADDKRMVALRKAAVAWAEASKQSPTDPHDRAFKRIDARLLRAARAVPR